jgi:Zn-dependent protease
MAHIDPVGMICFFLSAMMGVGFGWAKPVPINPAFFRDPRRGIILVSLAGVAANFALMIASMIVIKILIMAGVFQISGMSFHASSPLTMWIFKLILWFMLFNGVLIVFNLIPIPPMDGSKLLMMILPRRQAAAYMRISPYGFLIILLLLYTGVITTIITYSSNVVLTIAGYIFHI